MKQPKKIKTVKLKKKSLTSLKKKLWSLCRVIALITYPHQCFTCGAKLTVGTSNMQLAHFLPSSTCGAFLRHDLRNLRWGCYHCNINLGGNGAIFYRNMVKEIGQKAVDEIFADKNKITKADRFFYENLTEKYEAKLAELSKE